MLVSKTLSLEEESTNSPVARGLRHIRCDDAKPLVGGCGLENAHRRLAARKRQKGAEKFQVEMAHPRRNKSSYCSAQTNMRKGTTEGVEAVMRQA